MVFWNYCPNCGQRLSFNDVKCSNCGKDTDFPENDDNYLFKTLIYDIGFFANIDIDFSPYININANYN